MYNNSYFGNMQYGTQANYPTYNQGYGMYQPQQVVQKQEQIQESPFSLVRFGTLDEAKSQVVLPSKAIMFIKNDFSEIYVKSADTMGRPTVEAFKCSRIDENQQTLVSPVLDPKEFAKSSDLVDVVRKDDIKGLLTADDAKNFITKSDLNNINAKLDQLDKQIRMSELWKNDPKGSNSK